MMERTQTHEELLRVNRALRLLVSCNKVIFREQDEQKLLSETCRQIVKIGGYLMAWIGLVQHDENKTILPVAHDGYEEGYLENLKLTWADAERGQGPTGTAIRSKQTRVNHDFRNNPALAPWREAASQRGYQSSIALPLMHDGEVQGVLTVYSEQANAFSLEEASLLEELAHDLTFGMMMRRIHAESDKLRTDIRHVEAALHSSQEQYRLLFETSRDALMTVAPPSWKFTDANQATLDLFGVSSKDEFITLGPWDVSPERQPDGEPSSLKAQKQIARAVQEGSNFFEWRHKRANGESFDADVLLTRIQAGQDVFLQATVRDITQRKRAEETLFEHAYLLSESQRMAHIGSWSWDVGQLELHWSDEAYRIFGRRKGEFVPDLDSFFELIHPDDRAAMNESIRLSALGERQPARVFRAVLADGAVRVINGHGVMQFDEQRRPVRMIGTVQDITEQDTIEKALQESERRYRNFAEKLPLGVVITQNGLIKYVNQGLVDAIGYSKDELQGKPFLPFVYEEDRAWLLNLHQRRMRGEDVTPYYTFRVKRRDGQIRLWENHASSTEWMGEISSLGIVSDITERAALEEALRNSLHQLEEKEKSKSRFLAAAGHDMRQPLAAANLFIDALKFTNLNADQDRIVQRLGQSMHTFNGLLDSLLNISKLDAGIVTPRHTAINIIDLFNWLEQNFAPLAAEKSLGFRLHFPIQPPLAVFSDIGLLRSILMNLVSNAIKFTQRGSILVSARRRGHEVLVQVWDSGIGIDAEHMAHIFDEFYQVNNPQRDMAGGLGLGLSIAKRAMALLAGTISCRSRSGRGTVFEFRLPLDPALDTAVTATPNETVQNEMDAIMFMRGKHFVVVEDNTMVAEALCSWLERMGGEAKWFDSAEAALQDPAINEADCYIVDYMLSAALNGIQLLRKIQQQRREPICASLITGDTSPAFIQAAKDCSWPVLHKPADMFNLISSLMKQWPCRVQPEQSKADRS